MRKLTERNVAIMQRVLAGETCGQVAQDYGVTGERILKITLATFKDLFPQHRWRFDLGLARMRALAQAQVQHRAVGEEA